MVIITNSGRRIIHGLDIGRHQDSGPFHKLVVG